jgi:hypothetical protein
MCEACVKIREDMWAEIRDILNYNRTVNGPLSAAMKESIERAKADGVYPDEHGEEQIESVRAQMIAERCVFLARACVGATFHDAPPHMIMGAWAGEMMREEIRMAATSGNLFRYMDAIFGLNAEDDDSE